jgi:hypothetical protein
MKLYILSIYLLRRLERANHDLVASVLPCLYAFQ